MRMAERLMRQHNTSWRWKRPTGKPHLRLEQRTRRARNTRPGCAVAESASPEPAQLTDAPAWIGKSYLPSGCTSSRGDATDRDARARAVRRLRTASSSSARKLPGATAEYAAWLCKHPRNAARRGPRKLPGATATPSDRSAAIRLQSACGSGMERACREKDPQPESSTALHGRPTSWRACAITADRTAKREADSLCQCCRRPEASATAASARGRRARISRPPDVCRQSALALGRAAQA